IRDCLDQQRHARPGPRGQCCDRRNEVASCIGHATDGRCAMSDRLRWIIGLTCLFFGTCGLIDEHYGSFDLSGWWHTDGGETADLASVVIFYDSESLDANFAEKHAGQLAAMRSTAEGSLIDFCK